MPKNSPNLNASVHFFFSILTSAPLLRRAHKGRGRPFKYGGHLGLSQYGAMRATPTGYLDPWMQSSRQVTRESRRVPMSQRRDPRYSIPLHLGRALGCRFAHPRVHPRAFLANGEPGRQSCLTFSNGAMSGVAQEFGKPSRRFSVGLPFCQGMSSGSAHRDWGSRKRQTETKQRNRVGDGRRMKTISCCNSAESIQCG